MLKVDEITTWMHLLDICNQRTFDAGSTVAEINRLMTEGALQLVDSGFPVRWDTNVGPPAQLRSGWTTRVHQIAVYAGHAIQCVDRWLGQLLQT